MREQAIKNFSPGKLVNPIPEEASTLPPPFARHAPELQEISTPPADLFDLFKYYLGEVQDKIETIKKALTQLEAISHSDSGEKPEFDKSLRLILEALAAIIDLATIHGYQEVEAVAEKMEFVVRQGLRSGATALPTLQTQLQKSLGILQEITQTNDEEEARIMAYAVTQEPDDYDEPDEPFDIREPDTSAIAFITDQAVADTVEPTEPPMVTPSANEATTENKKTDDGLGSSVWAPSTEDERRAEQRIEEIFNEIVTAQIRENLDKLVANLKRLQFQQKVAEAIQEIQSCCRTLLQLGEKAQNPKINEILVLMNRLSQERLNADNISVGLIAAFRSGQKFLRWCLGRELDLSGPAAAHTQRKKSEDRRNGISESTAASSPEELTAPNLTAVEFETIKTQLEHYLRNNEEAASNDKSSNSSPLIHQSSEEGAPNNPREVNIEPLPSAFSLAGERIDSPSSSTVLLDEDVAFPEETAAGEMKIEVISDEEEDLGGEPIKFAFDFQDVEEDSVPPPKPPFIQRLKKLFGMY